MKLLSRLIVAVSAALLCLFLSQGVASANPGSNYTLSSSSAWVSAGSANFDTGAHVIIAYFNPSTDYWKAELQTRCLNAEYYSHWAWEQVYTTISKYPYTDPWRIFGDEHDSWDDGAGPNDHDYPGGDGYAGFHTPDYHNFFSFTTTTTDWGKFANTQQCEFRILFYNHT